MTWKARDAKNQSGIFVLFYFLGLMLKEEPYFSTTLEDMILVKSFLVQRIVFPLSKILVTPYFHITN